MTGANLLATKWQGELKRGGTIAAIAVVCIFIVVSLFAEFLAPFGENEQDLLNRLKPPSFGDEAVGHLLGTDKLGRDVLSRMLFAIRTSILIALLGTAISAAIGAIAGFVAAHFRGWVEATILTLVDIQATLPFLIIALTVLAIFGNSFTVLVVVIGMHGWETYARLMRGAVISVSTAEYVCAMKIMGAGSFRLYARHILPNVASLLIAQITLSFPVVMLLESGLSFIGLGVQPPASSLGLMVAEGRDVLLTAPWLAVAPGIAICVACLAVSYLGDQFSDYLNIESR